MTDHLRIDFGDGVSALDRAQRAMVLLVAQSINDMIDRGNRRDDIAIEMDPVETLPMTLTLHGEPAYRVDFEVVGHTIAIVGAWLPMRRVPRRRRMLLALRRLWRRIFRDRRPPAERLNEELDQLEEGKPVRLNA